MSRLRVVTALTFNSKHSTKIERNTQAHWKTRPARKSETRVKQKGAIVFLTFFPFPLSVACPREKWFLRARVFRSLTTYDAIGHFDVTRRTGSVLCRIALWDCSWDNASCFICYYDVAQELDPPCQSHDAIGHDMTNRIMHVCGSIVRTMFFVLNHDKTRLEHLS